MQPESTKSQNVFSYDVADILAIRPTSGIGPLCFSSNLDRLLTIPANKSVCNQRLLGQAYSVGGPTIFVMGTCEKTFIHANCSEKQNYKTVFREIFMTIFSCSSKKKPDGLFVCNNIRRSENRPGMYISNSIMRIIFLRTARRRCASIRSA